ncbi:MAG: polyphosphate kinase 1 [Phycisphaerales bacterium]|nr:polyphosphate kinase 1 [Phycisphaerales bacterium]
MECEIMPPPPPSRLSLENITTLLRTPGTIAANTTGFFNRDISWLEFNRRVLHEAMDPRTPLLERVKFLAIYSSNSDEFFMKRVGLLRRKMAQGSVEKSVDGLTASQQYQAVRDKIAELTRETVDLWSKSLRPALEAEGIYMRTYAELTVQQREKADEYFRRQIRPVLTPLAVDPGHPFPFISNQSLSIGVLVKPPALGNGVGEGGSGGSSGGGGEHLFARLKVPQLLSRWLTFQEVVSGRETYVFMPIESLIEARLDALFPGMEIVEYQHFRVTRNAEVEAEIEDPEDLLEMVQEELRARRFADTVRVQISSTMSAEMRQYLMEGLEVDEDEIYELPEPLGKSDLMAIAAAVNRPDLKVPVWRPDVAPALADPAVDIFALIRAGDILVHHPYESFDSSVERFILTAVNDPKVVAIKMTLYRTSGDSPFVQALARAAEAGKQVAVLVELKARFDEERNIQWAQTLEEAGAHVVYGVMGLKTHTKTALVVRREEGGTGGGGLKCYVHVATGNYNSKTAQLYTDLGLFTCREDICEDVVDLFAFLTGRSLKRDYRKLLVAPLTMRQKFLAMIEREARHAQEGKKSRIMAKMNALEDLEVIQALYKASQAGVPIDLIVRGFCCLRPGAKGMSENIRVISIVGRFLEHSRVFYFLNEGGAEEFYMGSADWMTRNLSHRVEAAVPIEDPILQARLKEVFEVMLADNRQAWDLSVDGTWTQRRPREGESERSTHQRLMDLTMLRSAKSKTGKT